MRGPSALARKRAAALASGAIAQARRGRPCAARRRRRRSRAPRARRSGSAASAGSAASYSRRTRSQRVLVGLGQPRRRPRRDGELAAQHERHAVGERDCAARVAGRVERRERAIEPAAGRWRSASTPPASSTFCASKCERSRYGVAAACSTSASRARYIACRFVSAGCKPNVPSRSSTPPSVPGLANAIGPRNCAYAGSAYGGTAARPSRPPRKMTSTNRLSGFVAAAASRANGASSVSVAPACKQRTASRHGLSPLKLGRGEQQREPLRAAFGARECSSLVCSPSAPSTSPARVSGSMRSPMRRPAAVANSMRLSSASPPFQFAAVSGQPAGEPGAYGRWPACVRNAVMGRRFVGHEVERAVRRDHEVVRRLELRERLAPTLVRLDQRAIDVRELAVAPQIRRRRGARRASPADRRRRNAARASSRDAARCSDAARACAARPRLPPTPRSR